MNDLEQPHLIIRRAAIKCLARRDYSPHELTQKLCAKGHALSEVEATITQLIAAGWINEQRFTENMIRQCREKGFGPKRIKIELQGKGIAAEMIAQHLEITDNRWFAAAHHVWQKRFKGKRPNNAKDRAKQMRFLFYRGFTREQIENLLAESDVADTNEIWASSES